MNKTKALWQKVKELNKFCNGSLSLIHFAEWEVSSYKNGSLFHTNGKVYKENQGHLQDKTFTGIVNRAYKAMLKAKGKQ